VFTGDAAHCVMDRLMHGTRAHIHRYSRVVHFKTTIRLMQGDSNPVMDEETKESLRAAFDGKEVTIDLVNAVLRNLGLARRYRRHRWTVAAMFGDIKLPFFDGNVCMELLTRFRVVEFWWDLKHKEVSPGRKVFFSYPFMFYQLCHCVGHPEMTGRHHLLKNARLSRFQFESYRRICAFTGLTFKEYE